MPLESKGVCVPACVTLMLNKIPGLYHGMLEDSGLLMTFYERSSSRLCTKGQVLSPGPQEDLSNFPTSQIPSFWLSLRGPAPLRWGPWVNPEHVLGPT